DNWGGIGYGDDIVAIYNRSGRLRAYSLEQIAPLPESKQDLSGRSWAYQERFSHSTSSRHWRENSIQFFYNEAGQNLFCLWLDWDNRWVIWQLSDGKMIPGSVGLIKQLNTEGRRFALTNLNSGEFASAALNFLGRQRHEDDRHIIEAWLDD